MNTPKLEELLLYLIGVLTTLVVLSVVAFGWLLASIFGSSVASMYLDLSAAMMRPFAMFSFLPISKRTSVQSS